MLWPWRPAKSALPLDEYVSRPDPGYEYHLISTIPGDGVTTYVLEMTSQSWLTEKEVDRTEWKHWMIICKPDDVQAQDRPACTSPAAATAASRRKRPTGSWQQIAKSPKVVVTELKMVPNEPMVFNGEDRMRKEDPLIAYTWDKFSARATASGRPGCR